MGDARASDCSDDDKGECRFHPIPLTLTRAQALTFTGFSAKVFAELERDGVLVGRRFGPHGRIVFETSRLRSAVESMFIGSDTSLDFDFGDD